MRVSVIGAGYVGLVSGVCLAEKGHEVVCVDVDPRKIGRAIEGRPVIAPAALPAPGACFVVAGVASAGAREHIENALIAAGYRAGRDYILAA